MNSSVKIIEPTEPLSWGRLGACLLLCVLFWLAVGYVLDACTPELAPTMSGDPPPRGADFSTSTSTTP